MSDKSLIDNELFVILLFSVVMLPVITFWLSKYYNNILNSSENALIIAPLGLLVGTATICILTYLIFKIYHWGQYLLKWRRMSCLKQKELAIKQNQQNNLNTFRRKMQNLSLEAKPLIKSENTLENKQKLEKILEEFLQPKHNNLDLHEERIKLIRPITDKIQQITHYLQSKEKETLEKKEQIKKNLGIEKGYFKKASLNEDQVKVLLDEDFVEVSCRELNGIGNPLYLLKPRHNESVEHFFLVMQIFEYLKDKVKNIELHNSVEPDIIFEYANQKIAIEVETGSTLDSKKEELLKKIETNNNIFGRKWYFVVTNKKLVPKYKSLHHQTYNRRKIGILLENLFDPYKNPCENAQKSRVLFINKTTCEIPQNLQSNSLNTQK